MKVYFCTNRYNNVNQFATIFSAVFNAGIKYQNIIQLVVLEIKAI